MANRIGLTFNPYNTFQNSSSKADQSVPTVADDYFNYQVPTWNSKQLKKATEFVNWAVNTPVKEQVEQFNVMSDINRWDTGFGGLSDEERALWEQENADKIADKSDIFKERLWKNQEYVKHLGIDDYTNAITHGADTEARDARLEDYLLSKAVYDKYKGNNNITALEELTLQGKRDLLKSNYLSQQMLDNKEEQNPKKQELLLFKPETWEEGIKNWWDYSLKDRASAAWEGSKSGAKSYAFSGSIAGGLVGGGAGLGAGIIMGVLGGGIGGFAQGILHPEDSYDVATTKKQKENDEILDKIIVADNERKKELVAEDQASRYEELYQAYNNGRLSSGKIDDWFDDIALNGKRTYKDSLGKVHEEDYIGSNHYSAFKDSGEFEHFGTLDKLRYIAQTEAIAKKFGMNSAMQVLDQDMQKYASEHQSGWLWAGQSGMNIAVGGVSNLANNVVGLGALATYLTYGTLGSINGEDFNEAGDKALSNYLDGKDASGEGNNSILLNPQYWNKVDQYNTLDPDAIAKADKNGGVSRWNNVVMPGTEGDFWTWNTANEALRMTKFAWSDLLKNHLLSKFVQSASTKLLRGTEISPGVLSSESPLRAKIANKIGHGSILAGSSLGIDVAYGMQTYNDVLAENNAKVDELVRKDTDDELKEWLQTPQAMQEFRELVNAANERRKLNAGENATSVALNEEEAWKAYVEHSRRRILEKQENNHLEEREQARADAAHSYVLDATIEAARMAPTNGLFKSYLFDKGTLAAMGVNNPYLGTTVKDGKHTLAKWAKTKKALAQVSNQIWGGFQSNYFDDVTVGFAKAYGIQDFNNYLLQKYNPAAYGTVLDNYLNPIVAGMAGAEEAMADKRSFIDGGVGALGAPVTFSPNIAGAITHKQRMKQLAESIEKAEKSGSKVAGIHWSELVGDFVNNPILQAVADAHSASRLTQNEIDRANKTISEHAYALDNMTETISSLNQVEASREGTSIMEAKDAKDKAAFTLAMALLDLKKNGAVTNTQAEPDKAKWSRKKKIANSLIGAFNTVLGSPIFDSMDTSYGRAIQTLEDAAAIDESSDEEQVERQKELLKTFIGLDSNKGVLEGLSTDAQIDIAKSRLKENAQGLLNIMEKTEDLQEKFSKSVGATYHPEVAKQLMYQYVMNDRFKERLKELEGKISNRTSWEESIDTPSNPFAKYGSKKGWERSLKAQEGRVEEARRKLEKAQQDAKKEDNPNLSIRMNATLKELRYREEIFAKERLDKEQAALNKIKTDEKTFADGAEEQIISAKDILKLNADDRLRMLDDYYRDDYSNAQQEEIDKAKNLLVEDGTVLNDAMERIRDAAILTHRIEDNMEAAKRIMKDPIGANYLQQALVENRKKNIIDFFNDKIVGEAFREVLNDSEATLSEENMTKKARNYSTAILRGIWDTAEKLMKDKARIVSDKDLQTIQDGIDNVLTERNEARKKVVELDRFLKKSKTVKHTEETPDTSERITTDRTLTDNDKGLIYLALDFLAERGFSTDDMVGQVQTEDFQKYIEERNHSVDADGEVVSVEDRVNSVQPQYMAQLASDVVNSFNETKETSDKAMTPKETATQPQSVATTPIEVKGEKQTLTTMEEGEPRPDEKPATRDIFGLKKKKIEQPIEEPKKSDKNDAVLSSAATLNSNLIDDVASLLEAINKMEMPEQTRDKIKDIMSSHLANTAFTNIKALQNKILEDALITDQSEAPQIDVMVTKLSNLELKKEEEKVETVKEKEDGKTNNPLFPNSNSPITTLESRDLDALLKNPVWKDYIKQHNVVAFLQKFSDALANEYEKWKKDKKQGPLHQGQFVFIYDPTVTQKVKEEIEGKGYNYVAAISAPVILALEITNKNKHLIDDESKLIPIKDKTDNKIHKYQVVGVMPSSEVRTSDSEAMKKTATMMGSIRGRINWEDSDAHVLRYAPKKGSKYNGTTITMPVDQAHINSHTEEDAIPHGTQETPKTSVQQLMEENVASDIETLINATEEERQSYQEAKEINSLQEVRKTSLYEKMRKTFLDRLVKREVPGKDADDPNSKELDFRIQKGTNDSLKKIVLLKNMENITDKNTGRPIVEELREVDNEGTNSQEIINSNSRFRRLFNQLSKIKLPSGLFDSNGNPVNVSQFKKTLSEFGESVRTAINNNLMVGRNSLIVDVEIGEGLPAEKVISIKAYYGAKADENLLSTLTTRYNEKLSPAEYALFLKDLILDKEGNVRKSKDDSRYDAVKLQVNYEDVNSMHDASTKEAREAARTNLEELYDDGIWEMQMTKLVYPSRSVEVNINNRMRNELYTDKVPTPDAAITVTEQLPVGQTDSPAGVVDGDTGMIVEPSSKESIVSSIPKIIINAVNKMIEDSKTRNLTNDGRHYIIQGQIWSRVTSIKYALDEMGERFDPNSPYATVSSKLGDSIDEFGRDVFNGVFDNMSEQERLTAFERYANSTSKNYAEAYAALKAFETRLRGKGQVIIQTSYTENGEYNPGHITAKGELNVTVKKENGVGTEEVRVAGTLDVLAIDRNGNLHIYDFKTKHNNILTKEEAESSNKGYDRQLSMYAKFLEDEYGLQVASINIIPIQVEYPNPKTNEDYVQQRPNSNQLLRKNVTGEYEVFDSANYKVGEEFKLNRLSDEKLVASFDKMVDAEKEAIVEAIQDQSDTPAETITSTEEIVNSQPIIQEQKMSPADEGLGFDVNSDTSFLDEQGGTEEVRVDDSPEGTADAVNPNDEDGFLARIKKLKKDCGGHV